MQQFGSANSIVATYSGVYVVDNPELYTCMAYWIHVTQNRRVCMLSFAQLGFCVRTRSGAESLCLAKWSCLAIVQIGMAATNSGPSDKALPISLADRHGLRAFLGKNLSACMKFGGNRCKDVEAHRI